MKQVQRGEIVWCDLGEAVGSEQGGCRPVVVVQNDVGNTYSTTTIVVPLTTKIKKTTLPTHYQFVNNHISQVACAEQIRTVDKLRLGTSLGFVRKEDVDAISRCVQIAVGEIEFVPQKDLVPRSRSTKYGRHKYSREKRTPSLDSGETGKRSKVYYKGKPNQASGGKGQNLGTVQVHSVPVNGKTTSPKPVNSGTTSHKPVNSGTTSHKPVNSGTNSHKPVNSGTNSHKPTSNGTNSHKPASNGTNSHKPASNGTNSHKPTSNGTNSHKPVKNGTNSPKPASNGTNSHKPASNGANSHKPASNGNSSHKPASSGNSTHKSENHGASGTVPPKTTDFSGNHPKTKSPQHHKKARGNKFPEQNGKDLRNKQT